MRPRSGFFSRNDRKYGLDIKNGLQGKLEAFLKVFELCREQATARLWMILLWQKLFGFYCLKRKKEKNAFRA